MQATAVRSYVLEHPAADPGTAAGHFAARLSVEADPSDVYEDLTSGVGGFVVVDARSPVAYRQAHIRGAINIPHREIDEARIAALSRSDVIVTYCWGPGCNAATKAALLFARLGFRVKEMIGGFEYWVHEELPVEGTMADDPPIYNPAPE